MVKVIFVQPDGSRRDVPAEAGASLMEAALIADVVGIDGECGGAGICGTCHIRVDPDWIERLPAPGDAEIEMVEAIGGEARKTRLACQIMVSQALDGLRLQVMGESA